MNTAYKNSPLATLYASPDQAFQELIRELQGAQTQALSHSQVEEIIDERQREISRRLLQAHLDQRSRNEPRKKAVYDSEGVARTQLRSRSRALLSLFGSVALTRLAYNISGHKALCPLEADLNMPSELYSHSLRRFAAIEATRGSFEQAAEAVHRYTGVTLPKRQLEQLVERASQDFEAFYEHALNKQEPVSSENLLVLSLDGKGIIMRPEDLSKDTRRQAEQDARSALFRLGKPISKRQRASRRRMATVAAVYDLEAVWREPEDILGEPSSFGDLGQDEPPRPRNKRVWAHIAKDARAVTRAVFDEAQRRDPRHERLWVVLVDGDPHQIRRVRAEARRLQVEITIVVDLIHVLGYLWDAAKCLFPDDEAPRGEWVKEKTRAVLEGQAGQVAGGLRRSATKRGLVSQERAGVDDCAKYLRNKKRYLDYRRNLERGLPIATGVIEGACRHVVKDRMDITGARWKLRGAEAVLKLRSLRVSNDFESYWAFHLERERERNHLAKYRKAA